MRFPKSQRGLSLIELMVAMAVSLLLMLGISQIFLGNKDSYRTQNELAALHQNARLARFVLENAIAHAGYMVDIDSDQAQTFTDGFISDAPYTNATYSPNDSQDYDSDSDTLTVRYQSDGAMNDCLGATVADGTTAHFQIYIDGENELQCLVFDSDGQPKNTAKPLIDNAIRMKVRFGLDSVPGDNNPGVDTYVDEITATNRDQVRSVRVQLLLKSSAKVRSNALEDDNGFVFAGETGDFDPSDSYHAYVMVDQVVALRNLLP